LKDTKKILCHSSVDTFGESVGGTIKWPNTDVCKVCEEMKKSRSTTQQEEKVEANEHVQPAWPSEEGKPRGMEDFMDYTQRRNWNLKEVELFYEDRITILAMGVISVPLAIDAVNNKVLGDKDVGITLMEIYRFDNFPNVAHGDLPLVAWPISCVKLKIDGRFLGDIIKETEDDLDDSIQVIAE